MSSAIVTVASVGHSTAGSRGRVVSQQPQIGQRLLTLDEVARMLGVSKAWVRDHATRRNPRIPVVRLGSARALLRFRQQDIDRFITNQLQGGV